jgi:adenosylcobinamide-phosphate synthase
MVLDLIDWLAPHPVMMSTAVVLDIAVGDPVYRLHPVRLMGDALLFFERQLYAVGADGYGGGIVLFAFLSLLFLVGSIVIMAALLTIATWLGWIFHVLVLYSLIALGDLLRQAWRVELALERGLHAARSAVAMMVGRDVDRMDEAACRRAAIESMSENLSDGFISALFWYFFAGLPGIVVFKVASTMDSMIGYKTPRYHRFGWCAARADDVMNYIPARLCALLIAAAAAVTPHCSFRKAWLIASTQHGALPSPNSGWPEAAMAGAIQRRLVGPIWNKGTMVTDIWLGAPADSPASTRHDMVLAGVITFEASLAAGVLAASLLLMGFSGWQHR